MVDTKCAQQPRVIIVGAGYVSGAIIFGEILKGVGFRSLSGILTAAAIKKQLGYDNFVVREQLVSWYCKAYEGYRSMRRELRLGERGA
jgi:hypothetical protein